MDIYENIMKQGNLISFVLDTGGTIIDTNIYTMSLLNAYDLTGKSIYEYLDAMSHFKVKTSLLSNYKNTFEVNLMTSVGDIKPAAVTCSKISSYVAVVGVLKEQSELSLLRQLEDINRYADFRITSSDEAIGEHDLRAWQLNNIDALTGLYNMKFFNSIYGDWYDEAVTSENSSGIILIDIDSFKDINEQYGYQKGDRILVSLGQIILSCIRSTDYAVRCGGEEFTALLNNIKGDSVYLIAERIRGIVENDLGITVSVGYTCLDNSWTDNKEEFMDRARRALSISKEKGRNRVIGV